MLHFVHISSLNCYYIPPHLTHNVYLRLPKRMLQPRDLGQIDSYFLKLFSVFKNKENMENMENMFGFQFGFEKH